MSSKHQKVTEDLQERTRLAVNEPDAQTFEDLLDAGWSFDPRNQRYHKQITAKEFARAVNDAEGPWDLTSLPGVGGPAATEIFFHLSPDEHLLWNSRTDVLLKEAGYEELAGNNLNSWKEDTAKHRYNKVREVAEKIHEEFNLPTLIKDARGVDVSDRTVYEVFDEAAYLHDEGKLKLDSFRATLLQQHSTELVDDLDEIVENHHYQDLNEVTRDACRRLIQNLDTTGSTSDNQM